MPRARSILAMLALGAAFQATSGVAETPARLIDFAELDGWASDDHAEALAVFRNTCMDFDEPDWQGLCAIAATAPDARTFFELFFRPVLIGGDRTALFTGYFEPELDGSRTRTARFRHPVYRVPPELGEGPWLSRAEIETTGVLEGRGLEIAWVDDAVELFFLQIQGSGRIRLTDGTIIRVGYGARNGHEYRSIGREMVRRGIYQPHQVSAPVIANWVRRNPDAGQQLLHHNPSYIFFPRGRPSRPGYRAVGRDEPVDQRRSGRSRSIRPTRRLGAPVWIEKAGAAPMHRLMIAQDTGGAIRGPQRADIFYGFGDDAGSAAGTIRDPGRMVVLLPIERAHQAVPDA